MPLPVVLSPYPLSRSDRQTLEQVLGKSLAYRSLSDLRRLPLRKMLTTLHNDRPDRCVLPLLDGSGDPLLPILHTFAGVAGFRRIEAVRSDHRVEALPIWKVPWSAAGVIAATAANARAVRGARHELAELLAHDRASLRLGDGERVVYLSATLWFGLKVGGSVGHTAGVVNGLAGKGFRVDLASTSPPPVLADPVRRFDLRPPRTLGVPFESNSYRFGGQVARQVLPLLGGADVRFLYQRLSVANYSGVLLSRAAGIPLVLEYNGSEAWTAKHWGRPLRYHDLATTAEDACLKHAHVVVTVSDVLRDELIARGVPVERVVSYPNCVDPSMFDPERFDPGDRISLRESLGISSDSTVISFIGTFGQWHGVDVLAQAIKQLVDTDHEWLTANRVRFLLVGDGLKAADLDDVLDRNERCADFVVRTGLVPQTDAPAFLDASDIVVSPHVPNPDGSRFFGSPTKLFEYMAMGKPIVASNLDQIGQVLRPSLTVGGLPEEGPSREHEYLAVLVEPANVEELIRGVRFLVDRPEWRGALGSAARSRSLERYTWRHHVEAVLERIACVVPSRS